MSFSRKNDAKRDLTMKQVHVVKLLVSTSIKETPRGSNIESLIKTITTGTYQ